MTGDYEGCFKCDSDLKDLIPIRNTPSTTTSYNSRQTQRPQPSGFGAQNNGGSSRGGGRGGTSSTRGRGAGGRGARGGATQRKRKSDHFDNAQGPWGGGTGGGVPVCGCGTPAGGPFTVRKEGPNTGREFFTCGKDRSCNYFQWKDEMATTVLSQNVATSQRAKKQNTSTNSNVNSIETNSSEGAVNCKCNVAASCLVVRKEGPNCGRPFFGCGNNRACNFFQWGDELQVRTGSRGVPH